MNILIVEDEKQYSDELIAMIGGRAHTDWVLNSEDAIDMLKHRFFDLIIIDLNIPLNSDPNSTESPHHGYSVFTSAKALCPGTPIIVLTGSSAEDFIESLIASNTKANLWGNGKEMDMVSFHKKHKLDKFPALLNAYLECLIRLKDVELDKNGLSLSQAEDRLIRSFALKYDGVKAVVQPVSGGLSGAKVFRITISSENGWVIYNSICKIGLKNSISAEHSNYENYISRLCQDATPRELIVIDYGAKDHSAIFYSLAQGFGYNVFDRIPDSKEVPSLVEKIESLLINWNVKSQKRMKIIDIRKILMSDKEFDKYQKIIPWSVDFEKIEIQVRFGCAHCDLHGFNILVSDDATPILIDYGDISASPSSIDPITLEFCIHFHPNSPYIRGSWPTTAQAKRWFDLDNYLINCPCPEYVKACRKWAMKSVAGKRELAAVAYSYFSRQLKYNTANQTLILAMLEGAKNLYDEET